MVDLCILSIAPQQLVHCSTQFNDFIYGVGSVYFAVCAVIVNDLLSLCNIFRIREFVYGIFYIRHFVQFFL